MGKAMIETLIEERVREEEVEVVVVMVAGEEAEEI